jgi:hypothetical protein
VTFLDPDHEDSGAGPSSKRLRRSGLSSSIISVSSGDGNDDNHPLADMMLNLLMEFDNSQQRFRQDLQRAISAIVKARTHAGGTKGSVTESGGRETLAQDVEMVEQLLKADVDDMD